MIIISIYKHRVSVYLTENEAEKINDYLDKTGVSLSFLANKAIQEFIGSNQKIAKITDARFIEYEGQKKTSNRDVRLSDMNDAILSVTADFNKISKSSLSKQAIIYYIDSE